MSPVVEPGRSHQGFPLPPDRTGETLALTRRFLLGLLVVGLLGTGIELLLMGHTEDALQVIPLLLIGLSLLTIAWYGLARSSSSLQVFRALMLLSAASGAAGSLLHYRGNVEFEIESSPGIRGFDLFRAAVTGATPALAPGTMLLLGGLGLLYTMRHPHLRPTLPEPEDS
jgi:hypothetical protein